MGTKSDFAQKLLNDLRLRKERMAAAQSSDAYGNSRQIIKGSREMKTLQRISTTASTYKSSTASQKSLPTIQATNQIVPYGRGHHPGQTTDFSMALAYAFDDGGKLKSFDFTGNGAMMGLLQQIRKRSTPQSSNMQWQPNNQFPTLTNLHIDEIARGAQKLNCILRACSNDLKIDKGSIEVGKELWKGAMELEQSLRMLVSLQEASDSMASPQRKSRLKLLEDSEDSEDDSPAGTEKQKQVERPVFSFDKSSKNNRSTVQTGLQQKLMALTYLTEEPNSRPETKMSMASKGNHRRSASCGPEFQTPQHTNSSKSKHETGKMPNVIAKLMGLEELAQSVNTKVSTESQTISKQISAEVVSTRNAYGSPRSAEMKIEYAKKAKLQGNQKGVQSNKITILKSHHPEQQRETYRFTYDYSYRATADPQKPKRYEEERESIRHNVKESREAIFKINELQSQVTQRNQNDTSKKDTERELGNGSTRQNKQEVNDDTKTLQTIMAVKNPSLEVAGKKPAETLGSWNNPRSEKRAANKPILQKQKEKRDFQLQQLPVLPGYETQGKKIKTEDRSQKRAKNKSEARRREGKPKKLISSRNIATDTKLQKQPQTKQPDAAKENNAKANRLSTSRASHGSEHNEAPMISCDVKQESSVCLEPEQNSSSIEVVSVSQDTKVHMASNMDAANLSAKEVVNDIKPLKIGFPMRTNDVMTRTVKSSTKTARVLKTQTPILHGLKHKKVENFSASQARDSMSKPPQMEPENFGSSTMASQQVEHEQVATTKNSSRDELQCQESTVGLFPVDKNHEAQTSIDSGDQHSQQIVPDEAPDVKPQGIATDGYNDNSNISYDLQPVQQQSTKIEKQEPLTEHEMNLKQKLIKSNLFLNTAEALFKLNIPISVLNYASEQTSQEKDSKLILDCGYEVLKQKGRRQEICFYPCTNIITSCKVIRSLDDLVRQLHKEFEALRSYGGNGRDDYDDANYLFNMLERDINYRDPDVNCMWDLGWNAMTFTYVEIEEVIMDVEQEVLDELVNEIAEDACRVQFP